MKFSLKLSVKGVKQVKWSNVLKVFRWEFLKNLKSPTFIITTLMLPLIMVLGGAIGYFSALSSFGEKLQIAVIDETGEVFPYLELSFADTNVAVTLSEPGQQSELDALVEEGELNGYLRIARDGVASGIIDYYVRDAKEMSIGVLNEPVNAALTAYRMVKIGLSSEEISLLTAPVRLQVQSIKGEEPSLATMLAPFIFSVLLFISVVISGQVLMYGVIKEKRNRIVEILLSSISSLELLIGKILGFGLLGLAQIAIWLAVGLTVVSRFIDLGELGLTLDILLPLILFFIGGYVMFASLFSAMGATMKDAESGSQVQGLVVVIPLVPIFASSAILMAPNAAWVRVVSYIPIFTPATMLLRLAATSLPWWEIASTFAVLLLGIFFFIYFGARIFSRGLLQFDRSLSFRDVRRMLKRDF